MCHKKLCQIVIVLTLIVVSVACSRAQSPHADDKEPAVILSSGADQESESEAGVNVAEGRRSQVTTRSFQAIEGGSEFLQTDSSLITVRPRDTIPAILDPIFAGREDADAWMDEGELVLGLEIGDDARAYPLKILSWHEIVNDTVGGEPVAVTW